MKKMARPPKYSLGPPDPPTSRTLGETFEEWRTATEMMVNVGLYMEHIVDRLMRIIKVLVALVAILFMVAGFLQFQLVQRQETFEGTVSALSTKFEQLEKSSEDTRVAAESAKTTLDAAIAQSGGGVDPAIIDALKQIDALYAVCVQRRECQER